MNPEWEELLDFIDELLRLRTKDEAWALLTSTRVPYRALAALRAQAPEPQGIEALRAENEALNHTLGLAHLHRSDVVFLEGYRKGVGDAFDALGERRDERMMVLVRRESQPEPTLADHPFMETPLGDGEVFDVCDKCQQSWTRHPVKEGR